MEGFAGGTAGRNAVLELLRRERGVRLDGAAWRRVEEWRDWWEGLYQPFHCYRETDAAGSVRRRELYSMRMAKKICEDWAGILLGEPPRVTLASAPSDLFLQGTDGCGGMLERCRFWQKASALVEKAFYSGTGAFVLRSRGMQTDAGGGVRPNARAGVTLECLPGMNIIPLSVEEGEITEAAFCSEILHAGRNYLYLETHTLDRGRYLVENRCFSARDGQLLEERLPAGVAGRIDTGSPIPLFSVIRPGAAPSAGLGGLGESVFAQAVDNLKGVDLAFNNFCRDFMLGGKKVFYNRSLLCESEGGALLAPDDICQQLFVAVGEKMPGDASLIHEHNPALRVRDNIEGLEAQLDYLSFKCGLGAGYYRFEAGRAVTATQYTGERQDLARSAARHGIPLAQGIAGALRMLLWAGKQVLGEAVDPQAEIHVHLDDSVIVDRETMRACDRADVQAGLMTRREYREKWYGESGDSEPEGLSSQTNDEGGTDA